MSFFKYLIIPIYIVLSLSYTLNASSLSHYSIDSQSPEIKDILKNEKNIKNYNEIVNIIERVDNIYSNLYDKIKNGKKLVVFIDPAHGKLPDGRWQGGAATKRQSCTNKPEEYYSTIIARELYKRLSSNPHIEVKSTPDFLEVMQEKTNIYKDISFKETIKLAREAEAFIIVSEHLNNVSVTEKASGLINIPGIHITQSLSGEKILKFVKGSHKGFLTLYNKFDASGFSKEYACNIKESLVQKGLEPNSWDKGVVADDRFTYFSNYPVSVIYESGFISNPIEEKLLGTPEYGAMLADSHYKAFIKTVKDIFNVDISGKDVKRTDASDHSFEPHVELIKMSQITLYYVKKTETKKAFDIIDTMQTRFEGKTPNENTAGFNSLKTKIEQSEKLYAKGVTASKNKAKIAKNTLQKNKTAKPVNPDVHFRKAYNTLANIPLYKPYKDKYSKAIKKKKTVAKTAPKKQSTATLVYAKKAPKLRTILLPIEEGQHLRDAIDAALSPDEATLNKLHRSFQKAAKFQRGIYLVTINDKLNVTRTKKVTSVTLNPDKYQNQQYLKNSFFASNIVEKSI